MAYNSAHTGPEIDAAVQLLGQIQDARDSTSQDLAEVRQLADQVKIDAGQVSAQTETVTVKAAQVASNAASVDLARSEVAGATAIAEAAKDAAAASAASAQESQSAASYSEQAAAQSQLAAGLSEQVSAESAAEATSAAEQVASDRIAAAESAASAAASAQNAEAVVTGGTASATPGPGLIPLANAQGKIDDGWMPEDIARTEAVQSVAAAAAEAAETAAEAQSRAASFLLPSPETPVVRDDGAAIQVGDRYFNTVDQVEYLFKEDGWTANDSLVAIDLLGESLADAEDPLKGAALSGFDGESVADVLEQCRPLQDYTVLKSYRGRAQGIRFGKPGIAGNIIRDPSVTQGDDGITFLDGLGRGWRRVFTGPILAEWYGADVNGQVDSTAAVQKAVKAANLMALAVFVATGIIQRFVVQLTGRLIISPQVYHASTNWSHGVLVEDHVEINFEGATIISNVAFANRTVLFLTRGDNIRYRRARFRDISPISSFAIGIGGGSSYDSGIGSNRTYRSVKLIECESEDLWQLHSFQMGTLDDGTVILDGIDYIRCEARAKPGNTSSGNFNFRSNPPHKIKNANMIDCKAWNGATASSFNYVGVDTGTIQNCESWFSLYAAAEIENGCKDISVRGLRSRDDAIGLWIDDSSDVTVFDIDTRNTLTSIVSPLHGNLGLIRTGIKISRQGYDPNKDQVTGKIQIFGARGKNWNIDINTYTTPIEGGNPLFSTVMIDGFDIDNDPTYLLGSGRGIFFSSVPFLTLRNGYIRGVVTQQILGSSSGGKVTIDNVEGEIKGNENPIGLTITGNSKSCISNTKLQSFTGLPSGSRMEQNCFDSGGARPYVTPGGQKHYYAVIGSPEGVLDGGPGSSARRSDTGQLYNKTGTGVNGWKLVTQAA